MDCDRTKQRIIVTAERLFAERGLSGVTVRQINEAAGQRNTSAIYYHFGNKSKLIEAIFQFRMKGYEEGSARSYEELLAKDRTGDVRAILVAMSAPMRRALFSADDWYYLRFVAQYLTDPQTSVAPFKGFLSTACVKRMLALLRAAVPYLPESVFQLRLQSILYLNIISISEMAKALHGSPSMAGKDEIALRYEDLMDTECAMLTGPVGARSGDGVPSEPSVPVEAAIA